MRPEDASEELLRQHAHYRAVKARLRGVQFAHPAPVVDDSDVRRYAERLARRRKVNRYPTVREVVAHTARLSGLHAADILSKKQLTPIPRARMAMMWAASQWTGNTHNVIAQQLKNVDRSTVWNGCARVDAALRAHAKGLVATTKDCRVVWWGERPPKFPNEWRDQCFLVGLALSVDCVLTSEFGWEFRRPTNDGEASQ